MSRLSEALLFTTLLVAPALFAAEEYAGVHAVAPLLQARRQMLELCIVYGAEVRLDEQAVVRRRRERVGQVVDDDAVSGRAAGDRADVFDEEVWVRAGYRRSGRSADVCLCHRQNHPRQSGLAASDRLGRKGRT